jgi:hypothetical protein
MLKYFKVSSINNALIIVKLNWIKEINPQEQWDYFGNMAPPLTLKGQYS